MPRFVRSAALLLSLAAALPLAAQPVRYHLEAKGSVVGFSTDMNGSAITGSFPVSLAELTLDFDHLERSVMHVRLDAAHAKASFPFAAEAMRGASVLDTGHHPEIAFASQKVTRRKDGSADVTGDLTIRGVTRPVTLHAVLHRAAGSAADDLSHLTVRLTGAIQRSAFGADGFADMVGDQVRLDIRAAIARQD